jgi:hypothetical protein
MPHKTFRPRKPLDFWWPRRGACDVATEGTEERHGGMAGVKRLLKFTRPPAVTLPIMISGYTLNNSDAIFGGLQYQPCAPTLPRPPNCEKFLGAVGQAVHQDARRTKLLVEGKRGRPGLRVTYGHIGVDHTLASERESHSLNQRAELHSVDARKREKETAAYLRNVVEGENGGAGAAPWSTTTRVEQAAVQTYHFRRPKSSGRTLVTAPPAPDWNGVPPGNGEYVLGTGHVLNNTPRGEYIQHVHAMKRPTAWTTAQLRHARRAAPLEYHCMTHNGNAHAVGKPPPPTAGAAAAAAASPRGAGGSSPWHHSKLSAPFGSSTGPSTNMIWQGRHSELLAEQANRRCSASLGMADPAQRARKEKLKMVAVRMSVCLVAVGTDC